MSIAATAGLAVAAIIQALDAVRPGCVQPLATSGLIHVTCPAAAAELVRGFIYAALAGVAFFTGLACFARAAYLHSMQRLTQVSPSRAEMRHKLWA